MLRRVGLLRLSKGVVRPTRAAADDDVEVVRRLRSWFEPGSFTATLASRTVAVLATNEPMDSDELPAECSRCSATAGPLTDDP